MLLSIDVSYFCNVQKSSIIPFLFTLLSINLYSQIQLLNDEFNDSRSLVNWKNINIEEEWGIAQLEHYSINDTTAGKLVMIPRTASWFAGWRGPLLYKEVSGDFVFTTKVDAIGRDNFIPEADFNLAGVMIRHVREYPNGALGASGWTLADNNYIFLSIGAAGGHSSCPGCNPPNFEVKSTVNGNSTLRVVEVDTTSTMIRIARIDDVFIVLYRLETDQTWVVHQRYDRGDFPDTAQVGLVTYTDWTKVSSYDPAVHNQTQIEGDECIGIPCDPDIIGEFEFARFDSLEVPIGLGIDFTDENDVTNAELLSFLDYDSEPYCPTTIHLNTPIDSNIYQLVQASQSISISDTIHNNSIVRLSAPDSILMSGGFQTNSGVILELDLTGCN